jgi:hypothetical protein
MDKQILFSKYITSYEGKIATLVAVAIGSCLSIIISALYLNFYAYDFSIPWVYSGHDDIWQLVLTKVLKDTGWVLYNPYLGAPDIASWHHNAAAQTSALHSVLMRGLSLLIDDAVAVQQVYYVLNFPLIAATSFVACRLVGISRLPAVCVGLIMAFTNFRMTQLYYSFLPNYFMVPLGLVPVYWIISGRFDDIQIREGGALRRIMSLIRSNIFIIGIIIIALLAVSDGYYAFFELLLIGFAFIHSIIVRSRGSFDFVVPLFYAAVIVSIALILAMPLKEYEKSHPDEYAPSGFVDPALIKHPFEAEVYSSTLKMMISPQPDHRIPFFADLGREIIKSNDEARAFKNGRTMVPLGSVGSVLFIVALILVSMPSSQNRLMGGLVTSGAHQSVRTFNAFLSVSVFVFLCSIFGGVGTIIALVFPTIRAYDRFPLFLIFTLFAAAAYVASLLLQRFTLKQQALFSAFLVLMTTVTLLDQLPAVPSTTPSGSGEKFLAERSFIRKIEQSVPSGSMIYQYPHSQYLENSPYYGWGSFAHVRLYLHSHDLRWSNGAQKNSSVETLHRRVAALPLTEMITEVRAMGFAGMVIDRTVVGDDEYAELLTAFAEGGMSAESDEHSKLAFVSFRDPGLRLEYDGDYTRVARLVVTDRRLVDLSHVPQEIDRRTLARWLRDAYPGESSFIVERQLHPDVFVDEASIAQGNGEAPIPLESMKGRLSCRLLEDSKAIEVTIFNDTPYNWVLSSGRFPLALGVHIRSSSGQMLQFDGGLRFPEKKPNGQGAGTRRAAITVGSGGETRLVVPLDGIKESQAKGALRIAEFVLVQDGHAWFNTMSCQIGWP